ncbi:MAG TPA: hypothetical protein VGQ59_11290 [Cyclobacteriaceae bacterium]|nr:hypothetical protein [Cyclobacteriaceae bacterium]
MKKIYIFLLLVLWYLSLHAQSGDFTFGKVTYKELDLKKYTPDTSAVAVVLNEFGEARFNDDIKIIFEYHVKIKILKKEGLANGDFKIPLYRNPDVFDMQEKWLSLEASTFNKTSNGVKETKFDSKNFILEKFDKNFNVAKFALPDVTVGSVIEVKYSTESPYYFQFHKWEFQSDIPKMQSEFWAQIPANFIYSISLRGFNKLSINTLERVSECFEMPGAQAGSYRSAKSDCTLGKYAMENIPAFQEERYMTAKSSFLSAIYFELSEVLRADGSKIKYAEEWKDVDQKLKENEYFGVKIRKARKLMEDIITPLVASENDELKKAQIIYDYFVKWYQWNGEVQKYSDEDPKKIYDLKKGSSADINLALIGALQAAALNADPVLVSTRDNGTPFKLHPQRSDFNYVVSSLKVGENLYLLDATEPLLPFGVLPIRCLNDQGRLVSKTESQWVDLKPTQKQKSLISMDLKLDEKGVIEGEMKIQFFGYDAFDERKTFKKAGSQEEYLAELEKKMNGLAISNLDIQNADDLSKPFVTKMNIRTSNDQPSANLIYFNPFMVDRFENNPFKSIERLYPVDLGAPIELSYFITLEFPESWIVDESPSNNAFTLPNSGGKCVVNVSTFSKKIGLTFVMNLSRSIYTSEEYHYLKEFFARIVQIQQSQFVLKKK